MKLYYGGFGDYMEFTVAENEQDAIKNIGKKINAPFLPITVTEISEVDGYQIQPIAEDNPNIGIPITEEPVAELRHCKKCDFACETQGQLLAHYRENHPKGD